MQKINICYILILIQYTMKYSTIDGPQYMHMYVLPYITCSTCTECFEYTETETERIQNQHMKEN